MYSDISFPNKEILEITFLSVEDFYTISFENNTYTIVGGDELIKTDVIGIAEDKKVYYILTDEKKLCYIAVNIETFIKELLMYNDYIDTEGNNLPENPDEAQLAEYAGNFKSRILESDSSAFDSNDTFWSEICEEMEYGF